MAEKTKKKEIDAKKMVCTTCGGSRRLIHKYGLEVCGRCFREVASKIGFKKYN